MQIRDFICLISSAKIIYDNEDSLIFKEGEMPIGFYIMIKGSIKGKISKLSLPEKIDSFFKREILQEYNLEENKDKINWLEINKDNKIENIKNNHDEYKSIFLSRCRISSFSPFSSIFQQRHEERLKVSKRLSSISSNTSESNDESRKLSIIMNEEVDLFIYDIDKDNILCFGNVNFFNEYIRDEKQIHLTSAYFHNKGKNNLKDFNEVNNIILYIQEENLKDFQKKISLLNKERIKFLVNTLSPLNQILSSYKHYFISTIKIIYVNIENQKELIADNNIFYLVYKGSCCEPNKKDIIYDKGSFIGLNNLFLRKKIDQDESIIINSKGAEVILFKIDLNFLSQNNQIKMIKFLAGIYAKQYIARKKYLNGLISYENKKIEQKEKYLDEKIQKYLLAHNINNFHRTDRDVIDKRFQKNENINIKKFDNVYINKNNIFKLISKSQEIKKEFSKSESPSEKNKKWVIKSRNSSNSSSPRTSRSSSSTLPFLNQSQKSLNNINQNPINIISYQKNYSSGKKSSKNYISRNDSNIINGFTSMSSFKSTNSLSKYDKFLSKANSKKKNFINKNILLKNFSLNNRKNKFHLLIGNH